MRRPNLTTRQRWAVALIVGPASLVLGVVWLVLGLHTHSEVKIAGHLYPMHILDQFPGLRPKVQVVQVGRDWWGIVLGSVSIAEGLLMLTLLPYRLRSVARARTKAAPSE